ncbi:hypothetical protein O3P69_010280 [Scylla paramamosain]|uniref:Uncharacterized protein n=1 Tax=Scylla paramamosain TaxID=85552 RepID=A0AAW0TT42_SCYPA
MPREAWRRGGRAGRGLAWRVSVLPLTGRHADSRGNRDLASQHRVLAALFLSRRKNSTLPDEAAIQTNPNNKLLKSFAGWHCSQAPRPSCPRQAVVENPRVGRGDSTARARGAGRSLTPRHSTRKSSVTHLGNPHTTCRVESRPGDPLACTSLREAFNSAPALVLGSETRGWQLPGEAGEAGRGLGGSAVWWRKRCECCVGEDYYSFGVHRVAQVTAHPARCTQPGVTHNRPTPGICGIFRHVRVALFPLFDKASLLAWFALRWPYRGGLLTRGRTRRLPADAIQASHHPRDASRLPAVSLKGDGAVAKASVMQRHTIRHVTERRHSRPEADASPPCLLLPPLNFRRCFPGAPYLFPSRINRCQYHHVFCRGETRRGAETETGEDGAEYRSGARTQQQGGNDIKL